MDVVWTALGLVLILEGIPWFLSPQGVRNLLRQVEEVSDGALRVLGFVAMVGLGMVAVGPRGKRQFPRLASAAHPLRELE